MFRNYLFSLKQTNYSTKKVAQKVNTMASQGRKGFKSIYEKEKSELWSKLPKPKGLRKNPPRFKEKFVVFHFVCRVSQKYYRYGL